MLSKVKYFCKANLQNGRKIKAELARGPAASVSQGFFSHWAELWWNSSMDSCLSCVGYWPDASNIFYFETASYSPDNANNWLNHTSLSPPKNNTPASTGEGKGGEPVSELWLPEFQWFLLLGLLLGFFFFFWGFSLLRHIEVSESKYVPCCEHI